MGVGGNEQSMVQGAGNRIAWPQVGPVVAVFALLTTLGIVAVQHNNGPDEPSHLEYIHILAWEHRLPRVDETHIVQHPPPYYLAMAVLWRALGVRQRPGSLPRDMTAIAQLSPQGVLGRRVLRGVSMLLGCATLLLLAATLAALGVPARHQGWLLAVIALNPMLQYVCAVVGNEALAICYSSLVCLVLVRRFRTGGLTVAGAARLGLLVGGGTWVKQTTLLAVPPLLVVVWAAGPRVERAARLGACLGAAVLAGCGWPLYSKYSSGSFFPNYVAPGNQEYMTYQFLHQAIRMIDLFLTIICTSLLPDWSSVFIPRLLPGFLTLLFWLLLPALVVTAASPGRGAAAVAGRLGAGALVAASWPGGLHRWRSSSRAYLLNGAGWVLVVLATCAARRPLRGRGWPAATIVGAAVGFLVLADIGWWYLVWLHYQSLLPR